MRQEAWGSGGQGGWWEGGGQGGWPARAVMRAIRFVNRTQKKRTGRFSFYKTRKSGAC